jgi:hypothetical protein
MKTLLTLLCCIIITAATAQTKVSKSYPVKPGQKIQLDFDYPKVIRISTWDKNEVSIEALVDINQGDNDTAFVIYNTNEGNELSIRNEIKNMKNLPRLYTVTQGGQKTVFRSKEDYREFIAKTGNQAGRNTSEGVDMQITMEIKVPANTQMNVNAKYGMVELVNFHGPANINAVYGGIDATIEPSGVGKLNAITKYGQIFTNLDLKLTDKEDRNFFTSITAEPGKGPEYILNSSYGKIYLRKQ